MACTRGKACAAGGNGGNGGIPGAQEPAATPLPRSTLPFPAVNDWNKAVETFCAEKGVVVKLYNISAKLTASMLEGWLHLHAVVPTKLVRGKHAYVGGKPSKTAFIQLDTHAAAKELITRPVVRMKARSVYVNLSEPPCENRP